MILTSIFALEPHSLCPRRWSIATLTVSGRSMPSLMICCLSAFTSWLNFSKFDLH